MKVIVTALTKYLKDAYLFMLITDIMSTKGSFHIIAM